MAAKSKAGKNVLQVEVQKASGKHADDEVMDENNILGGTAAENFEFSYTIKIPRDRVAVIIGKDGERKRELEADLKVKINVDSKEGDVTIAGKDSLQIYTVKEIIKAIGRGFNPEVAMTLQKPDYLLDIINILDYTNNKNHLPRLKGRIIGAAGKSRRTIEHLTDTDVCVYGKTVAIIGAAEAVTASKRAIEALLGGSPHSSVYKFLEKNRREMKKRELMMR
jgi:ribosomal RNA assembly protein